LKYHDRALLLGSDELFEVVVVGSVGGGDVVAELRLSGNRSLQRTSLANTEDKQKKINCVGCNTYQTNTLDYKVEKVPQIARHRTGGQAQQHLKRSNKPPVEER